VTPSPRSHSNKPELAKWLPRWASWVHRASELLKQHTRSAEPYQSGPATERRELVLAGDRKGGKRRCDELLWNWEVRLGLHGHKVLPIHRAHSIWEEVAEAVRILGFNQTHWWSYECLAGVHGTIYRHGGPANYPRSWITLLAHVYHVGKRHSEGGARHGWHRDGSDRATATAGGISPATHDWARGMVPRPKLPLRDQIPTDSSELIRFNSAQIFILDISVHWIFKVCLNRPLSILSISWFLLRIEQTSLIKFVHLSTVFKLTIGYLGQNRVNPKIWRVQFGSIPLWPFMFSNSVSVIQHHSDRATLGYSFFNFCITTKEDVCIKVILL
jgi:hypothetical protein